MEAVREEIKMFIHKSHRVIYEALAGNQCRGLGAMASPAQSSPVLCKVFVSVSPQIEMWLSGHPLLSPCLHPGTVLYSTASSVLCPSPSPAAPERRKGLSFQGVTVALSLLTARVCGWEHTGSGRAVTALLHFQELQDRRRAEWLSELECRNGFPGLFLSSVMFNAAAWLFFAQRSARLVGFAHLIYTPILASFLFWLLACCVSVFPMLCVLSQLLSSLVWNTVTCPMSVSKAIYFWVQCVCL